MHTFPRIVWGLLTLGLAIIPLAAATPANPARSQAPGFTARINATTRNRSKAQVSVVVARDGKALLPILTGATADKDTLSAAQELASTLEQICGGKFAVRPAVATDTGLALRVGTIAEFPTPSATEGLRIFNFYDGKEAYAIRTGKDGVRLLGATPRGVNYAVSRFLQLLGCRWFFQSPTWTVIPRRANVSFELNETDRPDLLARYWGFPLHGTFEKEDPDSGLALRDWWRRNRVGKSLRTNVDHSWPEIIEHFKADFAAHPEYLAEVGGERRGPQLCASHPEVLRLAIEYARQYFTKYPDHDMVGMGPADGGNYCTCAVCTAKFADPGDQAFYIANEVAKALQKSHPGKFTGLFAYNWHCDPPPFKLEPNVYVLLTSTMLLNTKYGFEKLLEMWPQTAPYVGVYDYWAVYDWTRDRLGSGRTCNISYVTQTVPEYMNHGICEITAESGNSWGVHGLGFYLASRLCWDRKVNVQAVLNDFYTQAFGPAAAAMRRYYERVDTGRKPLAGPSHYTLLLQDLEAARLAAAGQPEVLARIESLREYHVYWYLYQRAEDRSLTPEERKNFTFHIMGWNYHIRNTYMTFWEFFLEQTLPRLAREWNEPTWNFYQMIGRRGDEIPYRKLAEKPGWKNTDAWLAEARQWYGPAYEPEQKTYAAELVAPPALQGKFYRQHALLSEGGALLAIEVPAGEPLRLKAHHATIYGSKPAAVWTLLEPGGKTIATGEFPRGEHAIEIKVPRPGIYYLRYNDQWAGWAFTPDQTQKTAVILERATRMNFYRHTGFYFYVPKGTRHIEFYSADSNWFAISQPDGKYAGRDRPDRKPGQEKWNFRGVGRIISVPVPEGMDGKVWGMEEMLANPLWFFNCPNILFVGPGDVMIPRDLAVKDGWINP